MDRKYFECEHISPNNEFLVFGNNNDGCESSLLFNLKTHEQKFFKSLVLTFSKDSKQIFVQETTPLGTYFKIYDTSATYISTVYHNNLLYLISTVSDDWMKLAVSANNHHSNQEIVIIDLITNSSATIHAENNIQSLKFSPNGNLLTIPNAKVTEWNQPFGVGSFWERTSCIKTPFRPGLMDNPQDGPQPIFLLSASPTKSGCLVYNTSTVTI